MTKKAIIIRSIIASILLACAIILTIYIVSSVNSMINDPMGGLTILVLIAISIYSAPLLLFAIIFQIIMIVKKKFWILDFIASVIFVLSWICLYIVPIIANAIIK